MAHTDSAEIPHGTTEFEWPTWLVIFLVHLAWLLLLRNYQSLGPALAAPLLLLTLTWHSSICHEILHGHPTRIGWFNDLFAQLPLSLLVPYTTFKLSHLKHHRNDHITLPDIDPESFFTHPARWREKSPAGRALAWVNMTLAGRMAFGPGIALGKLIGQIGRDLRRPNGAAIAIAPYFLHFTLAGAIVVLADRWFHIPPWQYLGIAYLSHSLLLLRSYFEHRPRAATAERTVIMESCLFWQILFLNNNFHAVHHANPKMPWYRLKREYHRNRERYLAGNGHFVYRGYMDWLKHLFKPVAAPPHPFPPK